MKLLEGNDDEQSPEKQKTTPAGFEPALPKKIDAEMNIIRVYHLNHSVKASLDRHGSYLNL